MYPFAGTSTTFNKGVAIHQPEGERDLAGEEEGDEDVCDPAGNG